jgi:ribulose 1,5-bisphosphate synthetase/thiazole synthase
MEVTNDNGCSWIKDLIPRTNIKTLQSNEDCEWLVIGAGYTGLSAARKLGQLYPNQKIIIVDAQLAGEGLAVEILDTWLIPLLMMVSLQIKI